MGHPVFYYIKVILTVVIFYTINFFININKYCSSTCSSAMLSKYSGSDVFFGKTHSDSPYEKCRLNLKQILNGKRGVSICVKSVDYVA